MPLAPDRMGLAHPNRKEANYFKGANHQISSFFKE
jgi:hypothetical protein